MGNTIKTGMLASVIAFGGALSAVAAAETISQDTTWTSGTHGDVVVENATLTINGEVRATGNVDIGSANGGAVVDVVSGYLEGAYFRFGMNVPTSFSGDYLNKMFIRSGTYAKTGNSVKSQNKFPSLLVFDGGTVQFSSYNVRDIFTIATTNITLRGVNGHDISLFFTFTGGKALGFLKDWSDSVVPCRLRTEGECDVVLDANDTANVRMRVYGSSKEKPDEGYRCVDWHHTGDLVIKNRINMTLDGEMMLPFGAQTGGVVVDGSYAFLDFNGHRAAVNSIEVKSGDFKNSAATAATLAFCVAAGTKNLSDVLKATPTGAFDYEKIGAGTLVVDKNVVDKWTVTEGALAFAATAATPADKVIAISELSVDSPAMTTLIVDGVNVSCGSLTGSMRDKLLVVTKNGGTFDCADMGSSNNTVLRNSSLTAADTLVKGGSGTLTIVGEDAFAASLSVRSGTVRFRPPYITGGDKLMLRYTFKKTCGTNQRLMLEELRVSGYTATGAASDNLFNADGNHATRYSIRPSVADVWENGGMWVSGTYAESSTGSQTPLPYTPDWLFDNGASAARVYSPTDSVPVPGDASTWQQIVARVYWWAKEKKICGYNFAKGLYQGPAQGFPVSWTVEATTNGSDWSVIGEETDITPAAGLGYSRGWIGGTSGYPVVGLTPEKGLSNASCVRVDKNATLDLAGLADGERTISKIEIDQAFAGGKITDFVPAASGALYFVNVDGRPVPEVLLLAFDRISNAENLENWTVYVNGKQTNRKLYVSNGGLYLARSGLVFIVE